MTEMPMFRACSETETDTEYIEAHTPISLRSKQPLLTNKRTHRHTTHTNARQLQKGKGKEELWRAKEEIRALRSHNL